MASLNILCSDPHNFLKEVIKNKQTNKQTNKKVGKKQKRKFFLAHQKNFKNISRPINICLKCLMTPAKTLRPPPIYVERFKAPLL